MKNLRKIIGSVLFISVFGGLIYATCYYMGVIPALIHWGIGIGTAAIIVVGVFLLVD